MTLRSGIIIILFCISQHIFPLGIQKKREDKAKESIIKLAMDIWTQVDLVRAITVGEDQKELFLQDIAQSLIVLHYKYKKNIFRCNSVALVIKDLLDNIKLSLSEVFAQNKSEAFHTCNFIIEKLGQLKTKTDIESQVAR